MPLRKLPSPASQFQDDPIPASRVGWARDRRAGTPLEAWNTESPIRTRMAPPECAQFVLSADDTIQSHTVASAQQWFFQELELKGKSFRQLLLSQRPDWDKALPACIAGGTTSLYLPEVLPGASGVVLALHRLQHGEFTFVTAVPELAPAEQMKEAGMTEFQPDAATFAKLFVRLRTVEGRLDHYLSHLPGVVFHQRADLSFAFVGASCETLLGVSAATLSRDSQALLRLIHPSDERAYYQELDRNAATAKPFSLVYRVVNPQTSACIYLLDVRTPVRSQTGLLLGYEGVWLDITRQKIAEHRLTTRAWKENLSTLTSGLLNDFGNVMTGIYSLSELYHNTLPAKHPLRDGLGLIKDNAAQAQRVVRKIIELNRETSGDKAYANLGKLVRDQMELLKVILPRGTQLIGPASDGDWPVYVDEISFRQTLMNLAMNSRDALSGAGEIRVLLRRLAPGESSLIDTVPPLSPVTQPMVEVVFSDNGHGISPGHLPRVFDPFFSTKDANRGAGLGLYNARLFADSHQGQIAVRSTAGRGTEIVLLLPLADLSLLSGDTAQATHPGASTKALRAVLLDTDATDETSLADTLRHSGWEVHSVATVEHARRMLRHEGLRVDTIIVRTREATSSLRMFIAEVRRDHPGLPIALSPISEKAAESCRSLRTQVDLLLPPGIAERDAVDSLTQQLRLP